MLCHSTDGRVWRSVGASIAGPAHRAETGQDANAAAEVQDADGEDVMVIGVADGAGMARHAALGSRLAVETLIETARLMLKATPLRALTAGWVRDIVQETRLRVLDKATGAPGDYSATLLFALLGRESQWLCQIGDGAVAFRTEDGHWRLLCAPQRLEFANTTHFLVDEGAPSRAYMRKVVGVTHVALMTDGLDECALAARMEAPHAPFFDYMVQGINGQDGPRKRPPQHWLALQLGAPAIRSRSYDDKTLVVCERK